MIKFVCNLSFTATLLLVAVPARGEDLATRRARTLHAEGAKQYDLGDYRQALEAFRAAYLEKPDPALLFNIGQCHRKLGEPEPEAEAYRAYLRRLPEAPNRAQVEQFIRDAEEQVARRRSTPPDAITAAPAGSRTNAPEHAATAIATTGVPVPTTPRHRRWWVFASIGGAVAVALGLGLGVGLAPAQDAALPATTAGVTMVSFP
jgi:tetratricopeptide (TPR) repeat protein